VSKQQGVKSSERYRPGGDIAGIIERERRAKMICAELNDFSDLHSTLGTVLNHIRELTRHDAVGVRLEKGDDYPYFVHEGFPESLVKKAQSLCAVDETGAKILREDGQSCVLECMCGNVIQGRFDPTLPFFTRDGSFWVNDRVTLASSIAERSPAGRARDHCHLSGFESVALIPIKSKGQRIGLLHLASWRQNTFTEDLVEYLEMITEQVGLAVQNYQSYTRLEETERRFHSLVETASDAIVSVDTQGHVSYWNRAAEAIFGYTAEEATGRDFRFIVPKAFQRAYGTAWDRAAASGTPDSNAPTLEVVCLRKDGTEFPVELSLGAWESSAGTVYTAIMRDITQRKRQEEQLVFLATHDPLTGLPNRMLYHDRLCQAVAQVQRTEKMLAVMLADMDFFKRINDTFGHAVGDQLLQAAGERLRRLLRRSDTVARLGGDEFLVLLPDIRDTAAATRVAEKIIRGFRRSFLLAGRDVRNTISIGIAVCPESGSDPDTLIRKADVAMYMAKREGRDNYQYYTVGLEEGAVK
jgi:diguanylate cyclase (GGDEF)-like protein/PAS domain S-box-containing protein